MSGEVILLTFSLKPLDLGLGCLFFFDIELHELLVYFGD